MATLTFPDQGGALAPARPDDRAGLRGANPYVPPSGVTGGGFTPNFATNILNDPLYKQLQAQIAAQNQTAQGTATTGFGQALAQFGSIPDLTQAAGQLGLDANNPLYKILTGITSNPNVQQSAQSLTNAGLSTEAQLAQQHQTAVQNLLNSLAARGAVQSGDTGTGLRLADQANSQAEYGAHQQLLDTLGKLVNAYNTSQQQGIGQLQQGASQAAARQIALNPAVPASLASSIASMFTVPTTGTGGGSSVGSG